MVGIARKNENSADDRLSAPSSIAATMLAPERDTPGIIATHCAMPIHRYISSGNRVASNSRGLRSSWSTHSRIAPPAISVKHTTHGLKRYSLMYLPPSRPMITAGRNASRTPMTKRRSSALLNMPSATRHSLGEIEHDDRKDRAELNQHDEALPEGPLAEAEELLREQHMAGRRDRQKFRDPLDNAENHRLHYIRHYRVVHFGRKSGGSSRLFALTPQSQKKPNSGCLLRIPGYSVFERSNCGFA